MSDYQPGDRIRVESYGTVEDPPADTEALDGKLRVRYIADGSGSEFLNRALVGDCTLVRPRVKVGDVVTERNIDHLPLGTVIQRDGVPAGQIAVKRARGWYLTGCLGPNDDGAVLRYWGSAVIIYLDRGV